MLDLITLVLLHNPHLCQALRRQHVSCVPKNRRQQKIAPRTPLRTVLEQVIRSAACLYPEREDKWVFEDIKGVAQLRTTT